MPRIKEPTLAERDDARASLLQDVAEGRVVDAAQLVKRMRKACFATIPQYAARVNVNERYLGDIERGHHQPSLDMLEKIGKPFSLRVTFTLALDD